MKGRNWRGDGRTLDLRESLKPLADAMCRRQKEIGISGRDLSRKAGMDPSWLSGMLLSLYRPMVGRLGFWASLIQAQEFGLRLAFEEEEANIAVYDMDVPAPWMLRDNPGAGQRSVVVDLRQTLEPLRLMLQRQRRSRYTSVAEYVTRAGLRLTRNGIADLESGAGLTNPGLVRLLCWAGSLGAESFGPYIVIDGEYTDVNLLEDL